MLNNATSFSSFSVDSLAKAKEFYTKTLGLKVSVIPGTESMGMFNLEAGENKVMVYEKGPSHVPANFTVLNFLVKDIDLAVDELTKAGVTFESYDIPDFHIKTDAQGIARDGKNPAIAWFKDSAGNVMAVMEDMKK